LLLVAKNDRKIYIATGYGLEGALPDVTCKQIIENEIKPNFKGNDFYRGLDEGTDAIMAATKGEYKAADNYSNRKGTPAKGKNILMLIAIIVAILFMIRKGGGGGGGMYNRGGYNRFGGGGFFFPLGGGGSSNWGGGGSSGGGFGGFGGGSFGGGGSGGSW
jgi:uncharacterized protein